MMPHLWSQYTKKIRDRLQNMRYAGVLDPKTAAERGMRFVCGRAEFAEEGIFLAFYWLVDESDGIIADAKFQAIGPTSLLAIADGVSELAIRKTYAQTSRLSSELVDRHFRDKKDTPAFPEECSRFLNLALEAVDQAVLQCSDIAFAPSYDATPIDDELQGEQNGIPDWKEWSQDRQLAKLEQVIDQEIRPYIELDAGGIQIIRLVNSVELFIRYEGACTTCHASMGSTLSSIQRILRARVHPELRVIPELIV